MTLILEAKLAGATLYPDEQRNSSDGWSLWSLLARIFRCFCRSAQVAPSTPDLPGKPVVYDVNSGIWSYSTPEQLKPPAQESFLYLTSSE